MADECLMLRLIKLLVFIIII